MTNPHEEAKTQQNTDEDPAEEHAIQQAPVKGLSKKSPLSIYKKLYWDINNLTAILDNNNLTMSTNKTTCHFLYISL